MENFNVTLGNYAIKRTLEFRYLGIVLDECLSWNVHVEYTVDRAGKRLGMLYRIRGNIATYCADLIYKSYIRPITAEYADVTSVDLLLPGQHQSHSKTETKSRTNCVQVKQQ